MLRMNPRDRSVFIGESKETESPVSPGPQLRLLAYARWAVAVQRGCHGSILVVCSPSAHAARRWAGVLASIAQELGVAGVVHVSDLQGWGLSWWEPAPERVAALCEGAAGQRVGATALRAPRP